MYKLLLNQKNWIRMILPLFALLIVIGCGKEEPDPGPDPAADPIASFQYEIDANDFNVVKFSNFSQNATSYSWDFGDSSNSTEEAPSHTYAGAGDYTVTLTAKNADGKEATRSEMITLTDPNAAAKILTGDNSKTWKLFREGISMSLGPSIDSPTEWWAGLTNNGERPCSYLQEFTFHADGTYEFDDKGMFWGEYGVFNNVGGCDDIIGQECFEVSAATMVNACGEDVSAWGSGMHSFEYDPASSSLTLNGMGAWIGIPKLGTSATGLAPVSQVRTKVTVEEFTGYDVMLVEFIYGGEYWPARYVHYSDPSLEPDLVTETMAFGEDLPDASPTSLGHAFAEAGSSSIDTIVSGSGITFGVADPAGGSELVGEFARTDIQFQELRFQTSPEKNDINFVNLSSVSVDVYFPSTNDYTGTLTKNVIIGVADASETQEWWTDHQQYEVDGSGFAEDEWVTITFELTSPTYVAIPDNGATPYDRNDYDMIFLNIGSGNHTTPGTFYVRNLRFQ